MRALLIAALLGVPAAAAPGLSDVEKGAQSLAKQLLPALDGKKGKVVVLAFTPIDDALAQTPFGGTVQVQLTHALSSGPKKGAWELVERREVYQLMEDARLFGNNAVVVDEPRHQTEQPS